MKRHLWLFLLIMGLVPLLASAQKEIPKEILKTYQLEGEDFSETLEFSVPPDNGDLTITASGFNRGGKVKVYVYNPKGKKQCALGLDATNGRKAKGNLHEATDDPMPGIWKIKVVNIQSRGKISISVNQY